MLARWFPELGRIEDGALRHKALSAAIAKVTMCGRYWAAIAGIVVVSVWLQFAVRRMGVSPGWRTALGWVIVVATVLACWFLILAFRKTIRRSIRQALVDSGLPCCLSCGYDLTGNESGRCPECGVEP